MKSIASVGLFTALQLSQTYGYDPLPSCTKPAFLIPNSETYPKCGFDVQENVDVVTIHSPENGCFDYEQLEVDFETCCNIHPGLENSVRYANLGATALECAGIFRIEFETNGLQPGKIDTCCESCKCYGDPHCVSFEKTEETWVTCDTRIYKDKSKNLCRGTRKNDSIQKRECLGTSGALHKENKDNCVYKSASDWDWEEFGSRCQLASDYTPSMKMYENDAIKVEIFMGERGVLTKIHVHRKTDDSEYWLDAKDGAEGCRYWYTEDESGNRASINSDVNDWMVGLPDGWNGAVTQFGSSSSMLDVFWVLETGEPLDPIVTVQCLGYRESRADIDRRLNIRIDQGNDQVLESDTGFCKSNVITEKPDNFYDVFCSSEGTPLRAEFLKECMDVFREYCDGTFPETNSRFNSWFIDTEKNAANVFNKCKLDWCESRQLPEFEDSSGLAICYDDVNDFKFEGAKKFYPPKIDGQCVDFVGNLPKPEGDCLDGFDLQFCPDGVTCDPLGTEGWESHSWIAIDNYCAGSVTFNKDGNEELFENETRLAQYKCNTSGKMCDAWAVLKADVTWSTSCYEIHKRIASEGEDGWELYYANGDKYELSDGQTCLIDWSEDPAAPLPEP